MAPKLTMKAAVRYDYGNPDRIEIREVPRPTPKPGEVLIKVCATSVNASDWEFLTGSPAYVRMWGLLKPKYTILGSDVAGSVEAVGEGVTRFAPGDEVFGDILGHWGGFAEYVCAPETALLAKPSDVSFVQAATLPQAACVALQGLRKGQLEAGQTVLINGAGGGTGTFGVQLAKAMGASVTAVDKAGKFELLRSLGADHVVDHEREDFTQSHQRYDLVLDFVARRSVFDVRSVLNPSGRYVLVGGTLGRLLEVALLGPVLSIGGKKLGVLAAETNQGLAHLTQLVEAGQLRPVIDRCYPLEGVPDALRALGAGTALGKLVITM